MTYADKYLKDGVDVYEIANGINEAYLDSYDEEDLVDCVARWFNTTATTLTEDDKVILRNIDIEHYQRIGRVKKGLYVVNDVTRYYIKPFEPAFQFIKPRRRI